MYLIPVSAFANNYLWLLHDGKRALVVDPGDAEPVLRALKESRLQLESILVTHHHADHTGSVNALRIALAWISRCWTCPATRRDILPSTPRTWMAKRCFFAVTRFFRGAVAGCSKERRHKCWHRSTNWPRQAGIMAAVHRFDASTRDEATVFAAMRQWKNQFK